jgi:uncharacterized protein (TIGR03083 family)
MTGAALLDVTKMLRPERASLLALLQGLDANDWRKPTECPAWNVKELALHILGDDLSLLSRQRDGATNSLFLFAEDHPGLNFRELLDGFNEQWVHSARFFSPEVVMELLRTVGETSDAFYCEVGLETISGEPVGLFATSEPSPYWQVIAREYLERVVHQSQIRRAVSAPPMDGELVTAVVLVTTHLLAAWSRDVAAPIGTTVAFDFGVYGTWVWVRGADAWDVIDGESDAPADARIAVRADAVVAMVSRGCDADAARSAIDLEGDRVLGASILDIVAPLLGRPQP